MRNKYVLGILARYFILAILGVFNLGIFYFVFTPLTVYPVFWVLSAFDNGAVMLAGNLLFFKGIYAEIIPACVAGAAYYLLLILNMTTPMENSKRIKSILFLFAAFLLFNVARILIFAWLLVSGSQYFDAAHSLVWNLGSTILVIAIWFANVRIFRIKNIPVYTDVKKVFKEVVRKKKRVIGRHSRKSKLKKKL